MGRIVLALLAATVLLLLALLWRERQHTADLKAQLATSETRLARAIEAASKTGPRKPGEAAPPAASKERATSATNAIDAPSLRTLSEPERKFRQGVDEQRRWTALAKKADLLAAMNLPPDRAAALKDLLVERDYVERDARDAARAAGVQPHEAAAAEVAKIDARIQSTLGDADYARYTEQMSLMVFRDQVEGSPIPGSLVDAGTPLTPEQKAWMAGMMYRSFGLQSVDRPPQSSDPDAGRRAFAAMLLAEAPGKLTAEQIAALREYFRKDDQLAEQMNALIRERQLK